MKAVHAPDVPASAPSGVRSNRGLPAPAKQALIGLLALPLSVLPFLAYAEYTPEGNLLSAKVQVALAPPELPGYGPADAAALRARAPRWSGMAAVLVYHGMGATTAEQSLTISPERFAEQIATMKASGMNPITAADLAAARTGRGGLPDNAVLVTFDDGRTDAFMWADPVLEQAGWQATMFVITSEAGRSSLYYESWDHIADLARTGRWDIQSHSAGMHYEQEAAGGGLLPALTSSQPGDDGLADYAYRIEHDLDASVQAITEHIGTQPHAFAYPFGAYGAERVNDPRIQGVLSGAVGARFTLGFEQDQQGSIPLAGCSGDPLLTRRLEVGDWTGRELIDRLTRMAEQPASVSTTPCPPR